MIFERSIVRVACDGDRQDNMSLLVPQFRRSHDGVPESGWYGGYRQLCDCLDDEAPERLNRTVCVVDLSGSALQVWNLLTDPHSMQPARLVWRYPEVYWIFIVSRPSDLPPELGPDAARMHFVGQEQPDRVCELLERHRGGLRAWFDPWGLRRAAVPPAEAGGRGPGQARLGLVFDEESGYAVFNGYLLYRQGIPACLVATAAEFCALATQIRTAGTRVDCVLEDVELNYADDHAEDDEAMFMPAEPEQVGPAVALRNAAFGFDRQPPRLQLYVSATLVPGQDSVLKPIAGLDDPGIVARLTAPGWTRTTDAHGHSAPGMYQAMAAALLARARRLERDASDTLTALHGALLALEAERLLGDQTYAMTMEALAMRHGFEALAECAFAGATDELTVGRRLRDLTRQVRHLVFHCDTRVAMAAQLLPHSRDLRVNWVKLHKRSLQVTNGMLEVLGRLRDVYSQQRKAEEEERVLRTIRGLRVRLFRLKRPLTDRVARRLPATMVPWDRMRVLFACRGAEALVRGVVSLPLSYVTAMLKPAVLFVAVLTWIALFSVAYNHLATTAGLAREPCATDMPHWLRHSAVTFLAMQQGTFGDPQAHSCAGTVEFTASGHAAFWHWTMFEMGMGYFHLGLLVAVLVQKITRR